MKFIVLIFGLTIAGCCFVSSAEDDVVKNLKVTHKVWFDITISNKAAGRIEFGLFGEVVPKTVTNFFILSNSSRRAGYKGSIFHEVDKNFLIQGGDYTRGDGTGGYSIYGEPFGDENFKLKHYGAGWLSMDNTGENYNGSQFFITLRAIPALDGKFVVFGKVLKGMSVIRKIGSLQTTGKYKRPVEEVVIVDCGTEIVDEPFVVSKTDATD